MEILFARIGFTVARHRTSDMWQVSITLAVGAQWKTPRHFKRVDTTTVPSSFEKLTAIVLQRVGFLATSRPYCGLPLMPTSLLPFGKHPSHCHGTWERVQVKRQKAGVMLVPFWELFLPKNMTPSVFLFNVGGQLKAWTHQIPSLLQTPFIKKDLGNKRGREVGVSRDSLRNSQLSLQVSLKQLP